MKRKEIDDVSDEFSDFSLSSPACKIRRLNVDLPPIIEDAEDGSLRGPPQEIEIEAELGVKENLERAIVLYKSVDTTNSLLDYSPSGFSVSFDSNFLSDLKAKNRFPWSNTTLEEQEDAKKNVAEGNCMAVVPWVPSQLLHASYVSQAEAPQFMEADDMGEATMDIEEEGSLEHSQAFESDGTRENDGFVHWQQHCMVPNLPQNAPNPVTWFQ